jgi:aryl-alcohol dehydrogenase-like predicted oxidoreductase
MDPDNSKPAFSRRPLGATGLQVSPIALDGSIFGWAAGPEETTAILDAYRALGGNYLSTADHYGGGRSEIMIGNWLSSRGARQDMLLATKIGRHPDASGLSAYSIPTAVDACLERLRTDHIDVLALDHDHPETPIEETLGALQDVIAQGKVRFVAASGFSAQRLLELEAVAGQSGLPAIEAIVAVYSLMERVAYEQELAPLAARRGLGVVARLPLASGYLTGLIRARELPDSVMYANAVHYVGERGARVLEALESIAEQVGESLACVSFAWLLSRQGIATAALRATNPAQLEDVLAAPSLALTTEQFSLLDHASAGG